MSARGKRFYCLSAIFVLVFLGLALLAFGDFDWLGILGMPMYGTLFGQTALAAGWCALGPFSLARRLSISSIWLTVVMLAFSWNPTTGFGFHDIHPVLTFSLMVLVEWLLVTVSIWAIAAWFQLRIRGDNEEMAGVGQDRQIGVREAMILTAAVAAVFGAARCQSGTFDGVSINWTWLGIYGVFTVGGSVVAVLPMTWWLFARSWFWSVGGAIFLTVFSTAVELTALFLVRTLLLRIPGPGFNMEVSLAFSFMNLIQVAWIGVVLSLLYWGGFRIVSIRDCNSPNLAVGHSG
jgi:hypothetical protein